MKAVLGQLLPAKKIWEIVPSLCSNLFDLNRVVEEVVVENVISPVALKAVIVVFAEETKDAAILLVILALLSSWGEGLCWGALKPSRQGVRRR